MFGPLPKRQKKVSDDENKARQIIKKFCDCTGEGIIDYWESNKNEIVECLKAHPAELLEEKYKIFDTPEQCSVVDIMIRCGVDVDVVKELHELHPKAIEDLLLVGNNNNPNNRFTKLCVGFKTTVEEQEVNNNDNNGNEDTTTSPTCGGAYTTSITAEVLEFLIQQYPSVMASYKSLSLDEDPLSIPQCDYLLEFLVRLNEQNFITPAVIQTAVDTNPAALLSKDADLLLAILVQERCRKPEIMDALVKAMTNHPKKNELTVSLCTKVSRRELRKRDVQILSKLIPVVKKLTVPLTYSLGPNNGTKDILRELADCSQNSIEELVLEMPSRAGSDESKIKNLSNVLQNLFCSNNLVSLDKLVLKTRHLDYVGENIPTDNWMLEIFQQADTLPTNLTFLEFSNIEMDETFDLSSWFRTPKLPATVAFSGLKIMGLTMVNPSVDQYTAPSPEATLRHLEFFAEGDRDFVTDILTHHVGSAIHLESLSLGFSQRVDVTEAVRSLLRSDRFEVLDLHANTVLDLPAFAEMLRGNRGLRKFHKLQYPKKSLLSSFEEILKNDNTTLSQITMMPSPYPSTETRIKYYLNLNRFGRQQARDPSLPLETIIGLLCCVTEDGKLDNLQRVNTNYGLLRDSIIGTWSLAASQAAT